MKPIQSKSDYERAMARIMELMDADFEDGSPEDNELERLSKLVEKYEGENYPINPPTLADAIAFRIDQDAIKP